MIKFSILFYSVTLKNITISFYLLNLWNYLQGWKLFFLPFKFDDYFCNKFRKIINDSYHKKFINRQMFNFILQEIPVSQKPQTLLFIVNLSIYLNFIKMEIVKQNTNKIFDNILSKIVFGHLSLEL